MSFLLIADIQNFQWIFWIIETQATKEQQEVLVMKLGHSVISIWRSASVLWAQGWNKHNYSCPH